MAYGNEFGDYMTDSQIRYYDDGSKIIILSSWAELPKEEELFEFKVRYLLRITERLYFLSDKQLEVINKKISEIPEYNLRYAAEIINPPSYRLQDWMSKMNWMIPEEYTYDGNSLYSGLIDELNKFIPKDKID